MQGKHDMNPEVEVEVLCVLHWPLAVHWSVGERSCRSCTGLWQNIG